MSQYDHVIIGSGINALVCAAVLSRDARVLVLEREAVIGGTMRTAELHPGFIYDPLAMTFVLLQVSPVFAELGEALAHCGARFSATDAPTGVLMSDGRSLALSCDRGVDAGRFNALSKGDGDAFLAEMGGIDADAALIFGLFNNPVWSAASAKLFAGYAMKNGVHALLTFIGRNLVTQRKRLAGSYQSDLVRALFAPWPTHAGLDPEQPFSGKMGELITYALQAVGAPVAVGGAAKVPQALRAIIEAHGGAVRTGADVEAVLPGTDGRDVAGVRLAGGEEISAPSVICSVAPDQLYHRLLTEWDLPDHTRDAAARYAYGKGNMQLHYALERPVDWPDPSLQDVAILHLTDGVDDVSKASNEATRGMLPVRPTVCVGQPTAADPSRAPEGKAVLWVQLPEVPRELKGDAAGEIKIPADGSWNEVVREAYADRVEGMIAAHVPGFRDTILARQALSPADIAAMNINLVGGDPYGGWCGLDQFFLFRPFPHQRNHTTGAAGVSHIGASTHPGPGLSGMSGYLAAKALGKRKRRR
ncbi:MAG: NAD(P)/FAD-dependent oxidoreductase [Pseudomonadota bacterium]